MTITITTCDSKRTVLTSTHRTRLLSEAIKRAVHRHWGNRAFFWRDDSLTHGLYGQIMEPLPTGGNTARTNRIRIEVVA